MLWFKLFIYVIVAYNISFWMVYKNGPFGIFDKFRGLIRWISPSFAEVFECMNCTPTWVGIILSSLSYAFLSIDVTPSMLAFGDSVQWYVGIPIDAVFTSGIVYLIDRLETSIKDGEQQAD